MKDQLITNEQDRHVALQQIREHELPFKLKATSLKNKRSAGQNARMWAMLSDIARQVLWPVNGSLQYMDKNDWKKLLTAALRQETRMAAGINGGFVMLGESTSELSVKEMSDLIEYMNVFGAERGVRFTAPEWLEEMA